MKRPATLLDTARALSRLMREERIAQIRVSDGQVTDMILHPSAYMLEEEKRVAAEQHRTRKRNPGGEDELPVEPGNPVREEMRKRKIRDMFDGQEIADDDPDQFAHTDPDGDAFQ